LTVLLSVPNKHRKRKVGLLHTADWSEWARPAMGMMRANRIEVGSHRYTAPAISPTAPVAYANQALWDSCFHAIILRWFDPAMARDELLSLTAAQVPDGPDAGMIPHMIYWRGGADELWKRPDRSLITQPPLIAVAAAQVHTARPDRDFLAAIYPALRAYHDWFDRRRDPDGDGLVSLIHPWESGWDASPRWDRAMHLPAHPTYEEGRLARVTLAARLIEYRCEADALARDGSFCVEALDYNAIRAADLEAVAFIAEALGKESEALMWRQRAATVQNAVQHKMILNGYPYDLEGPDERPVIQESAAQYIALFGGCVTTEQAARLVEQLRQPAHWPVFPVPTTPTSAGAFVPDRYWRGNVWLSVNWLIDMGLRRYGYRQMASQLVERSMALVEQTGFWEYYHPLTGQGLGASPYSWSAIVLDLVARARAQKA
jgi:glycogen debranching enzyme